MFQTSVNSPIKPPTQNNKDGTPTNGIGGRRTSLSLAQNANFTANSPSSRPGNRRRDSADQSSLNSPIGSNRLSRDESGVASPPSSLLRRRTDLRDSSFGAALEDRENEGSKANAPQESSPFGGLKRTTTGPVAGAANGPSSPWSAAPQSAGFAPMGAFGNFSLSGQAGQPSTPSDKKAPFGSLRGESRFKGMMNPASSEDLKSKIKEKESASSLEKLPESANEHNLRWGAPNTRFQGSEINPYGDDEGHRTGSAALGGDDVSPTQQTTSRSRNPGQPTSYEDLGFSSLGMSSDVAPFRDMMQRRDLPQHVAPQGHNFGTGQPNEPMSPTNTNPFQSPEGDKAIPGDIDTDDQEAYGAQYHGPGPGPFGHPRAAQAQYESSSNDRSRTSSAGASRGFPNLSGLGGLGAQGPWSAAPGAIGTPSRANAAFGGPFGDSMFGSLGDLNSPSHGGSRFFDGSSVPQTNVGAIGRGSRMGSLFPNAMQEQMRGETSRLDQGLGDMDDSQRHVAASNAPGFGKGLRETESPQVGRGTLGDLFGNMNLRGQIPQGIPSAFSTSEATQMPSAQAPSVQPQTPFSAALGTPSLAASSSASYFGRPQEQDSSAMPASQQRQMVMPDRMRWIYRDPQGNTQGPWSGLEMHDWYKAGFFSPELQVKKLEDADYEPLAQLIRRIGNSREPFLVPQIGIPHGSSTAQQPSVAPPTAGLPATTPSAQPSSAQPPFASSFPSFGTTLTAEQQNALERRKQEEQYLMARQKEHLAQQQVMIKQMQHMQGGPGQQLHHHSSAHSLQSQPSYGSITSPTGYQPSPAQGPIRPPAGSSFYDTSISRGVGPLGVGGEGLGPVHEDELPGFMERMNAGRPGQGMPFGGPQYTAGQQDGLSQQQQAAMMLQDRARLQREQEQFDLQQRGNDGPRGTDDRLEQFQRLRSQTDEQQSYSQGLDGQFGQTDDYQRQQHHDEESRQSFRDPVGVSSKPEPLSLSEQVQKAAALQSPTAQPSPWAKVEAGLPQPFPPPQSSSPLPAPAAQRNRQNVADALAMESRSRSQTPSVETPSATVAPWAKEPTETTASKGPSLKEIQAMEARKAAQAEELATAARRAAAEQERQNAPQTAPAPAPGLPSSANWAKPATPTTGLGPSAWTKPTVGKAVVATPVTSAKRTLAQIQREEEVRKNKAAATAAASAANTAAPTPLAGGKRYADLASKVAPSISTGASNAWTTVGAGGKVKTPTTPAAPVQGPAVRTTSASSVQPTTTAKAAPKPLVAVAGKEKAQEEFQKWVRGAVGKGLNGGISGL